MVTGMIPWPPFTPGLILGESLFTCGRCPVGGEGGGIDLTRVFVLSLFLCLRFVSFAGVFYVTQTKKEYIIVLFLLFIYLFFIITCFFFSEGHLVWNALSGGGGRERERGRA